MTLSPKAENIVSLLFTHMPEKGVSRSDIDAMADNESRAEFAVDLNDMDATFKAETIKHDPPRAAQKRADYADALLELEAAGVVTIDGGNIHVPDEGRLHNLSAAIQQKIMGG